MNSDIKESENVSMENTVKKKENSGKSVSFNISEESQNEAPIPNPETSSTSDISLWNREMDLLVHCLGFSVGLGNLWRFPFSTYHYGGGAFLLPYLIVTVIIGFPTYYMELFLGQFTHLDPIEAWEFCPIFKGLGYSIAINCAMVSIYYYVLLAYSVFYFIESFRSPLPYSDCFSWWGADSNCYRSLSGIPSCRNKPSEPGCTNANETSSDQFWRKHILSLSPGIEHPRSIKGELAALLLFIWLVNFLLVIQRHHPGPSLKKFHCGIGYFTALFPFVILFIFFFYAAFQSGASTGLTKLFVPKWKSLLDPNVWAEATKQSIFSLGLVQGGLIVFGSKNKGFFHLKKVAAYSSAADTLAALISAMITFMIAGMLNEKSPVIFDEDTLAGIGLVFVTYPEAINSMPLPNLWSICFFFMFFILGLDTAVASLQTISVATRKIVPFFKKQITISLVISCLVLYLIGLSCVTEGGVYVLHLFDTSAVTGLLALYVVQSIAFGWGYGYKQMEIDFKRMSGNELALFYKICWVGVAPVVSTGLFISILFVGSKMTPMYGASYPVYAHIISWMMILASLLPIPVCMVIKLYQNRENIKNALKPSEIWLNAVNLRN